MASELDLPIDLASVHSVFYVSSVGNPSLIVLKENIGVKDSLSCEEAPIGILDFDVRKDISKGITLIK